MEARKKRKKKSETEQRYTKLLASTQSTNQSINHKKIEHERKKRIQLRR
jgi:hypothetical protein